MISYVFKLYPTKSQLRSVIQLLEIHKSLYNQCLAKKKLAYSEYGINLSFYDLIRSEVKKFNKVANHSSLQQTVRRLEKAYNRFYKQTNKYPRYKRRFRTIEFGVQGDGWGIKNHGYLRLQHVGYIKCKFHRSIPNDIKTIRLTLKNNNLYVGFIVNNTQQTKTNYIDKVIGIDFGMKTTLTLSNGDKFNNPCFYKLKEKELSRLTRNKNWKAINKVYTKINNQRQNFNHQLSRYIVNNYNIICIEDIQVSKLYNKISNIRKKYTDISLCRLKNYIIYKAENAGKQIVLVDSQYTTQLCSKCGKLIKKTIKQRLHKCTCGLKCDRDVNAAKNILTMGLHSLGIKSDKD